MAVIAKQSGAERAKAGADVQAGVLVLKTQGYMLSAQAIHATILRLLPRDHFRAFAAIPSDCDDRASWASIPDLTVWVLPFGMSLTAQQGFEGQARAMVSGLVFLGSLLLLAVRMRRAGVRIVHTTLGMRDVLGGLALSYLTGAKLVLHVHELYWGWYPVHWRLAFRRAGAVFCVSEASRQSYLRTGARPEKLHVLHNGVDLERFQPSADESPVRRELGLRPETPLLLLPGRLNREKGQIELIRAVALLKERGQDVSAALVGDDDRNVSGDVSFRSELESLRDRLGLADRVHILGHRTDMPDLLTAADVMALPSYHEGLPMVVLEAMACARPVVATRVGGVPELVDDGATGLLIPPRDVEALAEAIERLVVDPELRQRLGQAGQRQVEKCFGQRQMARRAGHLYETLLRVST